MDDLLTTKQVQDLLQVDRTTIYRMQKDGRLKGTKIGHQWRFSRQEVQALLSGEYGVPELPDAERNGKITITPQVLPLHCVQPVQDVFAEIAEVGAVTTAPDGQPLTGISNACRFCEMILATESGREACIASWRRLAWQETERPQFVACHAGLQYARARIEVGGQLAAMLIAGQFYADAPDPAEEAARLASLAARHGLNAPQLQAHVRAIPVLDQRKRAQIGLWLEKVARTFEDIGSERAELMGRLNRIAAMSTLTQA